MKIPGREIQLFVAGAIAVNGFDALFWLFYYLANTPNWALIFSELTVVVALPLGVGILIGRHWAVFWTQIYLWILVILGLTSIPVYCYAYWPKAGHMIWRGTHDMLVSTILLGLMLWSRSRRLRQEAVA